MMSPAPPLPAAVWRDPFHVLALGFGAGALPRAPGTWGTLAAVPFYSLLLRPLDTPVYLVWVALLFVGGVWWCGRTARLLRVADHPAIVWDEMVGFWLTMAATPGGLPWLAAGFILFRLFDIWKPWPVRRLERLPGGLGIMLDDVAAAVYAALLLGLIRILTAAG
jgi:phosphatidylglycerophosphatase A